jgi:cytochrome c-type biogenesis protein CcmH
MVCYEARIPMRLQAFACALLLAALPLAGLGTLHGQEGLGVDTRDLIGEPQGTPRTGTDLDRHTEELTSLMRCPVCQGLSIADSGTMIAMTMKEEVRQLIAEGYTDDQILLHFETSYGEFIRLEPKAKGFNLVVWIAPLAALLLGLGLVIYRLRPRPEEMEVQPDSEPEGDDLAAYRDQVRREVRS